MLISLDRYRRKRWRFSWSDLPAAQVIRLPVACPPLIPPYNQIDEVEIMDDPSRIQLYRKQALLIPNLGIKIDLAYRALVLEVGQEAADAQVWTIVSEYLNEKEAA